MRHGLTRLLVQRKKYQFQQDGKDNDRPSPIADHAVQEGKHNKHRVGQGF